MRKGLSTEDEGRYAHDKIASLARYAPEPTEFARVRLTPIGPRTIAVHVNLDVNGTPLAAKVEAPTFEEAVDAVQDQLHVRPAQDAQLIVSGAPRGRRRSAG